MSLAQFAVEPRPEPTIFERIWSPIETVLQTGADVFSKVAPFVIKTPYPLTPAGEYQAPITTDLRLQQLRQRQAQMQPFNLTLPLLALGGVLLFTTLRKRWR